jgi:hypothetical protein
MSGFFGLLLITNELLAFEPGNSRFSEGLAVQERLSPRF